MEPAASPAAPLYSIGEMARLTGLTARALRFYEDAGVLTPTERTDGGYRMYNEGALQRARFIADLRGAGLSLELIRDILTLKSRHQMKGEAAKEMTGKLQAVIEQLRSQAALLHTVKEDFAQTVEMLDTCCACEHAMDRVRCDECDLIRVPGRSSLPASFESLWGVTAPPRD